MTKDYEFSEYLRNRVGENTREQYSYWRNRMIQECGSKVDETTITEWWNNKKPCIVNKSMLKHLMKYYRINCPLPEERKRKKQRPIHYYQSEETKAILDLCTQEMPDYYGVIWLHIECGLRIGEAVSVKRADIKATETPPRIFIPALKGNVWRYVYPSPELINHLLSLVPNKKGFVFGSPMNEDAHITPEAVRYHYRKIRTALGLPDWATPHVHRHTYATTLVKEKVGLRTIQEALGHSSPETTAIYAHVFPEEVAEASKKLWIKKN